MIDRQLPWVPSGLRVCLVSLDFSPFRSSGLTNYAEDLAGGLHDAGHSVTVVAARRPGTLAFATQEGIDVHRVPIGRSNWIAYCAHAAALVDRLKRERSFDIVHFMDVHFAYPYRGAYVASLWQSFRQRLHAVPGWPHLTGLPQHVLRRVYYLIAQQCLERTSVARAVGLIAACDSTAREFMVHYHVSPNRIGRAVQGVDLAAFRPVSAELIRRQLGLEGKRVVLSVGYATPRKGLEYMARALKLLPPDVTWVIVGQWQSDYRRKVFAELGSEARRVIAVGPVADDERATYYSLADVYVAPSLLEGLGRTPLEAQACGTPAIVSDASSGPEEVGDTGIVVPARDATALAAAVAHIIDDPVRRFELGARARERVLDLFTHQRMTEQTLAAYRRFLG